MEDQEREKKFQVLQTQLNHILMISPVVIYTASLEYPYPPTFVSDNLVIQTGYEPRECIEEPNFWLNRTHPDDLAYVLLENERLAEVGKVTY